MADRPVAPSVGSSSPPWPASARAGGGRRRRAACASGWHQLTPMWPRWS